MPGFRQLTGKAGPSRDYCQGLLATAIASHQKEHFPEAMGIVRGYGQPIPREAYSAYIVRHGGPGIRELIYCCQLELDYLPELAGEIGWEMTGGERDRALFRLSYLGKGLGLDPEFQLALAVWGGNPAQYRFFRQDRQAAGTISPRATKALVARGSRFAPKASAGLEDRFWAKMSWENSLLEIRQQYWATLSQIQYDRDEAAGDAWGKLDNLITGSGGKIGRSGQAESDLEQRGWQAIFDYLEAVDEAKAARRRAIDQLIDRGPDTTPG